MNPSALALATPFDRARRPYSYSAAQTEEDNDDEIVFVSARTTPSNSQLIARPESDRRLARVTAEEEAENHLISKQKGSRRERRGDDGKSSGSIVINVEGMSTLFDISDGLIMLTSICDGSTEKNDED